MSQNKTKIHPTTEKNIYNKEIPNSLSLGISVIGKETDIPDTMIIGTNCIIYPDLQKDSFTLKSIKDGETFREGGLS